MARKPRWYCEPWNAVQSTGWASGFRNKPTHGDTPEEVAQNGADWEAAKAKAQSEAEWFIRGANLEPPTVCRSMLGVVSVTDGGRILMSSYRLLGAPKDTPSHGEMAERACDCVNALEGIQAPAKLLADVRALLFDLSCGKTGTGDHRIVSCLARMIPPEELKEDHE